jgi:tRNA-2-methylthio-N6-dimethylallyladenosine synthase
MAMNKKVFLKSWGCQMNVRDSEVIAGLLTNNGYRLTNNPVEAEVVIFNTCSVRQHAEDKVWSEVGRISKLGVRSRELGVKRLQTPNSKLQTKPIIGIVGCMAQNYKEKIFERAPNVDFVVGPSDIHKIPEIINKLSTIDYRPLTQSLFQRKIWETDGNLRPDEIYHTGFYQDKEHAYIVISEGCSNYCSYCVVPYVRGELHSRDYEAILKEIEEVVDKGITKITLLGQNVNAYRSRVTGHGSQVNFVELLKLVNQIKGLKGFSFITSHPKDTSIDLFKAMADSEKLKKHLHLPVQSGSDRILELMNRGYAHKFYLNLIENYRKIIENGVLTTDIIVGFPTEKEEDFKDSYNLVKNVEFDAAYIFKYSVRPNTNASTLTDDVPKCEKERRHRIILDLQKDISKNKPAACG